MGLLFTVDARQVFALQGRIGQLGRDDLPGLGTELAELSEDQTQRRFSERRTPDGRRWPSRRDSLRHPLLELSGDLRGSIEGDVFGLEVEVRTVGIEYALTHQEGDPSRNIRRRQFLGWGERDLTEVVDVTDDWLARYVGTVLR